MENRIEKAVNLFKEGFNCSQAVFTAFADLYNLDEDTALKLAAGFGGGIGRMRQTCGAACGLFLLAGLENGATQAKDAAGKEKNYRLVQRLAQQFKEENGSINCSELLGLSKKEPVSPTPEKRTENYLKKRPCPLIVESAARIWSNYLMESNNNLKEQKND